LQRSDNDCHSNNNNSTKFSTLQAQV
jgi:hypothetical protein